VYHAPMAEGRTEGAQERDAETRYVSVGEAAKLLGVHRNTVRNRIKDGRISAHKVIEGEREVYRVDAESLGIGRTSADVHNKVAQRTTSGSDIIESLWSRLETIVHEYNREMGDLRERLGEERVRREHAEQERDRLAAELEALREARESPETPEEEPAYTHHHRPPIPEVPFTEAEPLEEARLPWWRRWFG
jgi:excisionase family DNA binding protein